MRSFSFASVPWVAQLGGPPPPPPPPTFFSYADTGFDGLETNLAVVSNVSRGTHADNMLLGNGAGLFGSLSIETTQFRVLALQQPSGSDFTITVQDSSGAVVESGAASSYAADARDSSILWQSSLLPRDTYTIRVQTRNTGGGDLLLDAVAYEGTARPFPYEENVNALDTNMMTTGGFESLNARLGTIFYATTTAGYAAYTPSGAVTRLLVRSPLLASAGAFSVTVTSASGTVVRTDTGTCHAAADAPATIVYDSGPLVAGLYTIRVAYGGGGTFILDGFNYQPA